MITQPQEFTVISAVTGKITTIIQEVEVPEQVEPTPEERRAAFPPLSRRQLRLALVRNGFSLSQVTDLIEQMPEGLEKEEAQIEWEDASYYDRLHPTLITIAEGLNLSPEQVDVLWQQALSF